MMKYQTVINQLKKSVNNKGENKLFIRCLLRLKNDFGQEVSRKFLIKLCNYEGFTKKASRVDYLIKNTEVKPKKVVRPFREWVLKRYNIEVITYARNEKKKVYPRDCELTQKEQQQINELKEMASESGVELMPRAEQDLKERQRRRDAFNKGGCVYIQDVRHKEGGEISFEGKNEVVQIVQIPNQ